MPTRHPRRTSRSTLAAVVASVLALTLTLLPGDRASADHTGTPTSVVLVGSLQDELGCPGDWQPECTSTALQPVAGQEGVYAATFTVPAGGYEYKVALNGSWNENYGSGAAGGANIPLTSPGQEVTFTYNHHTHVISDNLPKPVTGERSAQWLRRGTIAVNLPDDRAGLSYRLYWAPTGGLKLEDGQIVGGQSAPLRLTSTPTWLAARYPHLAAYETLSVPSSVRGRLTSLLTGQLAVAVIGANGKVAQATGIQLPGVLDDVYANAQRRTLGPVWRGRTPRLSVWAPTAKRVRLLIDPVGPRPETTVRMARRSDGTWTVRGRPSWKNAAYRYEVTVYAPSTESVVTNKVTDPYSVALTMNSTHSVLADLDARGLTPKGWNRLTKPKLAAPEWQSIYELHVRDFSIADQTVPAKQRGTYLAFTRKNSDGMRHLRSLARAGLSTVHLLPVNDIASIEEDPAKREEPTCDLAAMPADSAEQQACVGEVADKDGFNWGYDPLHYTTPEGSYATRPDGVARTRQFRRMVQGLNGAGLRVVIDVVYNHTPASGQDAKSVLDRIVPGYYHRLSLTGAVETSTCCANTATEHAMMGKLMTDSVLTWASEYKVDGFRFDLMGHQPKALMVDLRRKLDRLTLKRDGVDGKKIYLYGEGWNFGEVANNARFVQATQAEMAGTGIGTFSDRLRDAVRGGGPFDATPYMQGFASGLATDPNGHDENGSEAEQKARLLLTQDQIKVGLAGNLKNYRFVDRTGATVTGAQVDYNGSPAGYTLDPQEVITYVEAHDNETLFDELVYKLPGDTTMDERSRMQTLALATTAFGQGVSFWHAGGDILRSKSLDRNSYNSGDWFNVLDFTYQTNGFGRGLPPERDNGAKWDIQRPLLGDAALKPSETDIRAARLRARDLLRVRKSTPLFHLATGAQVQQKVSFPQGGPDQPEGVIVMRIDDRRGTRVDKRWAGVVVVYNATPEATTQRIAGVVGQRYRLHPVLANGSDVVVQTSRYDAASGGFTVPARSVAVFVTR